MVSTYKGYDCTDYPRLEEVFPHSPLPSPRKISQTSDLAGSPELSPKRKETGARKCLMLDLYGSSFRPKLELNFIDDSGSEAGSPDRVSPPISDVTPAVDSAIEVSSDSVPSDNAQSDVSSDEKDLETSTKFKFPPLRQLTDDSGVCMLESSSFDLLTDSRRYNSSPISEQSSSSCSSFMLAPVSQYSSMYSLHRLPSSPVSQRRQSRFLRRTLRRRPSSVGRSEDVLNVQKDTNYRSPSVPTRSRLINIRKFFNRMSVR